MAALHCARRVELALPVQALLGMHGVQEVRAKLTATPRPQMLFPYTDPEHDVDVSSQLDSFGGVELRLTKLVRALCNGRPAGRLPPASGCLGGRL
jgi:hypothetical protein